MKQLPSIRHGSNRRGSTKIPAAFLAALLASISITPLPAQAVEMPAAAPSATSGSERTVRIREITTVEGARENSLMGYGLVVGLHGTGDQQQTVFTTQMLANVLLRMGLHVPPASIMVKNVAAVFVTAVYGGYFGAAQGVILISLLGIFLDDHLQRLNAAKNFIALAVNGVAALIFIAASHVAWEAAGLVAAGAVVGGQLGGALGRRLPPGLLRGDPLSRGLQRRRPQAGGRQCRRLRSGRDRRRHREPRRLRGDAQGVRPPLA